MPDNLVNSRPLLAYLAFGSDTYHHEAVFSICSAVAQLRAGAQDLDIRVYTDNPEPYRDLPVQVQLLDVQTLKNWCEPHGYHFRVKHVLVRELLLEREVAILIDTDTLFHTSPLALFALVRPGVLLCNEIRETYGSHPDSLLYIHLRDELQGRALIDDQMHMLNSGVIGMHRDDIELLDHSIALMDDLFPRARGAYILEEFCLAMAARNRVQVCACPTQIHHYWSRKQLFRAKVRAWLGKHSGQLLSEAALDDIANVRTQIPRPPTLNRLTYKLATMGLDPLARQFMREVLNGCYKHPNEFDQACATVWWDKARENFESRAKTSLDPQQLELWLNTLGMRLLLGDQRRDIARHLERKAPPAQDTSHALH